MKNRLLRLLRRLGLYHGPIHYVMRPETAHFGVTSRGLRG